MTDNPELRRQLGSLLRQRRRSLEPPVTQRAVAEHLGVAQNSVSDWERGESWPTAPALLALVKFLGMDPAEVIALLPDANGAAA